jgi:hypothetical protein
MFGGGGVRIFTGGGNGAESRNEGKEQKSGKAEHGKVEKRNRKRNRLDENMVYDIIFFYLPVVVPLPSLLF